MAKHVNRRGEIVDDLVFNEQQKRKRAPKPKPARVIPSTSCCGTCENWAPPTDTKEIYGECAVVIAAERSQDKAVMYSAAEAKRDRVGGMPMRCAESFVCSQYHGPHELLPIAHANVEFKTEVRTMHDLIQEDRGEWEWPA